MSVTSHVARVCVFVAMQANCQTLECDAVQDMVSPGGLQPPRYIRKTQDLKLWEHDKMINIRADYS